MHPIIVSLMILLRFLSELPEPRPETRAMAQTVVMLADIGQNWDIGALDT